MSTRDPVLSRTWSSLAGSRFDLVIYCVVFVAGLTLFFAGKAYGASQLAQTVMLCSLMALYAFSVAFVPKLRFRMDQAGDNAYYLGLLFTLSSMAYALYVFQGTSGDTAGTLAIIQNFGIALATTIAGIFLRVLLHQMRVDPADLEHMTRIELTDAAGRVKAELENLAADFAQGVKEMRQHSQDVVAEAQLKSTEVLEEFAGHVKRSNEELTSSTIELQERLKGGTEELVTSIQEFVTSTSEATERLRSIKEPPLRFSNRVDKLLTAFEGLEGHVGQVSSELTSIVEANRGLLEETQLTLDGLGQSATLLADMSRESADGARKAQQGLAEQAGQLSEALKSTATSWNESGDALKSVRDHAEHASEEIRLAGVSARETISSLEVMVERLIGAVDEAKAVMREEGV